MLAASCRIMRHLVLLPVVLPRLLVQVVIITVRLQFECETEWADSIGLGLECLGK